MILIAIGVTTIGLSSVILAWQAVEERNIRWRLYGLRDELRLAAIEDTRVAGSPLFPFLDSVLTAFTARLEDFSLWQVFEKILSPRDWSESAKNQKKFKDVLSRRENASFAQIYAKAEELIVRHLFWRHLVIGGIFIVTLVGVFPFLWILRKVAKAIVEAASDPELLRKLDFVPLGLRQSGPVAQLGH